MNHSPLPPVAAAFGMAGLAIAGAAEIREYDPARHDRFTGFPDSPQWNDGAWFGSRSYSAVGWSMVDPRFQYALISPRHFVYAAHNAPAAGTVIRFLDANGDVVERGIAARAVIQNADATNTDLALGTLAAPVDGNVGFFPVLNLPSDSAYVGSELVVFGWDARVGRGEFHAFHDGPISGTGETRLYKFLYRTDNGDPDDIYLVSGDSGSPTFALAGGGPALLGTHSAAAENVSTRTGYDTFVPAYLPQLDALMEPLGHRVTRAFPDPIELDASLETTPAPLRQAAPGTAVFSITNVTGADAANVKLTLEFPQGSAPDGIGAPGWIIETAAAGTWTLRRGGIDAGETATLTASWNVLPATDSLIAQVTHVSDGSPLRVASFDLAPAPSYAAWSAGLVDPDSAADPDGDGASNLLEYAFGGDPAVAETPGVLPQFDVAGGRAVLTFPMRTDAHLRGLSYIVEWSPALEAWSPDPPPGWLGENAELIDGFVLRTVSFDVAGRLFVRVRIQLDEGAE